MTKLFISMLLLPVMQFALAQNVGIGTTVPNGSALLDITSTNKGVLFPRMSTIQRTSIPTPPNGLMVFDTNRNELYQYLGPALSWRAFINDAYWRRQSLTRSRIGNLSDSVGIGTLLPTEWLDVDGNIRTRNTLIVDNNVVAVNTVSGGTLNSSGNLFVNGASFLNSNITSNGDVIVINPEAILQLRNGSNVNKGFFQLSGDDVRLGTNSGNATGDLVIRMNGNNRVTINPAGDMDIDGQIKRTAVTGSAKLLPVCMGEIDGQTGAIINGTGNFTVVRSVVFGQRNYEITSPEINATSMIFLTPKNHALPDIASDGYYNTGNTMRVEFNYSVNFYFIIYTLQ
jgi:hypothetical protein